MAESSPPAADILKDGFLSKQVTSTEGLQQHVLQPYVLVKISYWDNQAPLGIKPFKRLSFNGEYTPNEIVLIFKSYYVKKGDNKPKKVIDLTEGRGVREKKQCTMQDWPGDAKFCFGVASSKRTWYFYGSDGKDVKEWMDLIQQCIEKVGKPTKDWGNDPEGKPESVVSKAIRNTTKTAIKHGKGHIPSTGNEYLDGAVSTAADVAENQLDADPHASAKDRLKMAGGDVISGVADTVDNPVVTVAANVAKDQLEADEDLSLKQRLALAGGSAVEGVGEVTEIDAVGIAGGVIKDQATADEDASLKERMAIGVGSVAAGVKEGADDALVYHVAKSVEQGAGDVADHYADNRDTSSDSE